MREAELNITGEVRLGDEVQGELSLDLTLEDRCEELAAGVGGIVETEIVNILLAVLTLDVTTEVERAWKRLAASLLL